MSTQEKSMGRKLLEAHVMGNTSGGEVVCYVPAIDYGVLPIMLESQDESQRRYVREVDYRELLSAAKLVIDCLENGGGFSDDERLWSESCDALRAAVAKAGAA